MAIGKQLAEIAICSVAMPATVGLCLWVLLGPLGIDRLFGVPPVPELTLVPPVPKRTLEDSGMAAVGIVPGESGHWVRMQRALIRKGYSVGPADADGNDETLTALEAFQDNNALPVQPTCDQQCWTALGLGGRPG